jgi:glutathione S-transferase
MKLYYKPGACSMAARIVLNESDAPYTDERVDTETGRAASGADYRAINPRGYVPALQQSDGTVLTENAAILGLLAELYSVRGALPDDAYGRARLAECLSFLSSELHKAFGPFFAGRALTPEERDGALARLARQIGHVEAMLADGRDFLLGDEFSVADAYGFVILNWTGFIGVSLVPWPHVLAFYARIGTRPSVALALKQEGLAA